LPPVRLELKPSVVGAVPSVTASVTAPPSLSEVAMLKVLVQPEPSLNGPPSLKVVVSLTLSVSPPLSYSLTDRSSPG
jgi:hypothetical protein